MFECPLCDAEIDRDITSRCPECGAVFCVHCHLTVAANANYKRCNHPECRYHHKMLCDNCLIVEDPHHVRNAAYGAITGIVISLICLAADYDRLRPRFSAVAGIITFVCILLGLALGLWNIERCPRCEVNIRRD